MYKDLESKDYMSLEGMTFGSALHHLDGSEQHGESSSKLLEIIRPPGILQAEKANFDQIGFLINSGRITTTMESPTETSAASGRSDPRGCDGPG